MPVPGPRRKPPKGYLVNYGHPLAQNLVACFVFNEGGGNLVQDVVGGHVTGALSGAGIPKWSAETDGPALTFNAGTQTNSYIDCGKPPQMADLALGPYPSTWFIRFLRNNTTTGGLCERNDNNTVNAGWMVGYNAGQLQMLIESSVTNMQMTLPSLPTPGVWHDWIIAYDGTQLIAGTKMYVDGRDVGQGGGNNGAGSRGTDAAQNLFLGREQFRSAGSWDGRISTIAMWKGRMLTLADAEALSDDPWAYLQPRPSIRVFFIPASHTFTQSLNASMGSWAGALVTHKVTVNLQAFTVSMRQFSATLATRFGKALNASMGSWAGALSGVKIAAGKTATLNASMGSFAGTLVKSMSKQFSASMAGFSGSLLLAVQHGTVPSTCTPVGCANQPNLISHVEVCENPGS